MSFRTDLYYSEMIGEATVLHNELMIALAKALSETRRGHTTEAARAVTRAYERRQYIYVPLINGLNEPHRVALLKDSDEAFFNVYNALAECLANQQPRP